MRREVLLFPANAGVIPTPGSVPSPGHSFPRICGGSSGETYSLYVASQNLIVTQTVTHTGWGAGGDNGEERSGTDT